jgi:Raf kinase inhibitor-like YbhB/YbcL family protein
MAISSPAFASGRVIPRQYTCDGRGISPPLEWSGAPAGTHELVLLIRDVDAPSGNFVHWVVAGIPPGTDSVTAGHAPRGVEGVNSAGSVGYTPPCPPHGEPPHRYLITILALARHTNLRSGFDPSQLAGTGLASGTLTGTYARR